MSWIGCKRVRGKWLGGSEGLERVDGRCGVEGKESEGEGHKEVRSSHGYSLWS